MSDNYIVIHAGSISTFQAEVNSKIKDGYSVSGGVFVIRLMDSYNCDYFQAMIKKA